jgi:hypothetical protein
MKSKKELKNEYKQIKLRRGIFQIINKVDNKIYLQTTSDIERAFSSDLFQLKFGMHSNTNLQNDWNNLGEEAFEFSILDEYKPTDEATPTQIKREINELLKMHKEEMTANGQMLY